MGCVRDDASIHSGSRTAIIGRPRARLLAFAVVWLLSAIAPGSAGARPARSARTSRGVRVSGRNRAEACFAKVRTGDHRARDSRTTGDRGRSRRGSRNGSHGKSSSQRPCGRKSAKSARTRHSPTHSPSPEGSGTSTPPASSSSGAPDPASTVPAPALAITGTTYYVSAGGSDSNSGTSPSAAWRTVRRVNETALAPGDGVLFEGGASFGDEVLMPPRSGSAGAPIVFGSYGAGDATLPQGVWFKGENDLGFEHLAIGPEGNLQGTGSGITVEWCSIGNDGIAINATNSNSDWTIDDNTVNHTGNSGMLLEGEDFTVSGNTITNTGLDSAIPYGKHGIYLKVANATVTRNTIVGFSADGISARYRNSTIAENYIADGEEGIAWFQDDPNAGTSHWTANTITGVTVAGIYVSPEDAAGKTRESFVIEHNDIQPAGGATLFDLKPTTGTYTVLENILG